MTEQTPTRARAGDQDAFRELTDPYRRELRRHIYRIVGSPQDAEALLRETLLAAWRGIEPFQARVRPRVAGPHRHQPLARCAARGSAARAHERPALTERPEPTRYGDAVWLAPYPDALLDGIPDRAPGPEARYEAREAIALAFVAGLQHRPPQQRAVLVLRDVLGYRAAEVAALLETTQPSVNSLLRRARAAFESRLPTAGRERSPLPGSRRERDVAGRFADALQTGVARPYAMLVLTLQGERISAITWFGGSSVFPRFGLPRIVRYLGNPRVAAAWRGRSASSGP